MKQKSGQVIFLRLRLKKFMAPFLCITLVLYGFPVLRRVRAEPLSVSAAAAILLCADSQEVLYEKDADQPRAIASITKILTAVIALEEASVHDRAVTFEDGMKAEGSSMHLQNGEVLRLSELVKGMMAVSGNDAANALAVAISGSQKAFAERMNEKARQLGMTRSHFVTPSGLDDEEHYATARDMALLCCYAMEQEAFCRIVSQSRIEVDYILPAGKTRVLENHNKLLQLYEGCIGIKTGYTKKAGRTLTSCAEREGVRLIAVTLCDGNDWEDHQRLFDYGFSLYEEQELIGREERFLLPVVGAGEENIPVRAEKACRLLVRRDGSDRIERKLWLPHFCYAPVGQGSRVGEIGVLRNGREVWRAGLLTERGALRQTES